MRAEGLLLPCLLTLGMAHAGDPMSEARALGEQSVTTIHGGLTLPGSSWIHPALEASPGGQAPYWMDHSLDGQIGASILAECTARPSARSDCEAVLAAGSTAQVYAQAATIVPADAQLLRQGKLPLDSALSGLGIAGAYSGCVDRTVTQGQKYYDEQACHNYYLRALDLPCAKALSVTVTWVEIEYLEALPDGTLEKKTMRIPVESDTWSSSCLGYEARVPPGLLPPDGINPAPESLVATGPGPFDKCERVQSICTQGPETRIINDHPVTRACWAYSASFNCVNLDMRSDCGQPRWGQCTFLRSTCIDWDVLIPDFCTAAEVRYSCLVEDTTRTTTVTDCQGQVFTEAGGSVWPAGSEPDNDLARVVAFMEAGREAGGYLDPDSLEIFKGFANRCRKKLFGLVNCCNKGGTGSASLFSNSAIAAVTTVGKAGASTYMYDALFVSDAPNLVINGFASLFGSGTSSALAGFLAGQVSVESFLTSLIPGPWSLAMMALQFSGLISCEDRDIETALKRDARLCVDLGEYCSKKLPIIKTCVERTSVFCCFNSVLAKAVNTQGKAQLGATLGTAREPNCGGFTAAQLQRLDLSAMDLSEFTEQVIPATLAPGITSCYFQGDAACAP